MSIEDTNKTPLSSYPIAPTADPLPLIPYPYKILVTYLMHLGDLLLTTPFLQVLRRAYPDAQIDYLVDEKLADVVSYNPNIDNVLTIDKKGKDNSIGAIYRYTHRLSKNNYDLLINLHPNERTSFLCAATKAKRKVGASHKLFGLFFDQTIKLNKRIHAADMYLDVLKQLGITTDLVNDGLQMPVGEEAELFVQDFYSAHGVKSVDRLIGFNIGSAVLTKRWAGERFAQVADYFANKGYKIVFFGGSMDIELVQDAVKYMQTKPIIATGEFNLQQLAAAMQRCALIVTNDSGPMHVAISQGVPIVAMYGPSIPDLYGPYTDKAVIVRSNPICHGCEQTGMKHKCEDMQCMRNLTVEQVIEAGEKMLC